MLQTPGESWHISTRGSGPYSFIGVVEGMQLQARPLSSSYQNSFCVQKEFKLAVFTMKGYRLALNPFSTTRRYKRHQNKVKVKGLGRNSSYLAVFFFFFFFFFFFHGSMKKFN